MAGSMPPNGRSGAPTMSMHRLQELLDAYGASSDRWPPQERTAALELLEKSADARAARDEAARLDALLDRAPAPRASAELAEQVLAGMPARPAPSATAAVRAAVRAAASDRREGRRVGRVRRWHLASAAGLAAAAAAVLWTVWRPAPSPPGPQHLAIAELGAYETPTDVLLSPPGLDLFSSLPSLGCTDGGLGCAQLEQVEHELESRLHLTRRERA